MLSRFLPRTLQHRFMAVLGIVFFGLAILIIASILAYVSSTEASAWKERQVETARFLARDVEEFIAAKESILNWFDLYGYDEALAKPDVLNKVMQEEPSFVELIYLDAQGRPVLDAARGEPLLGNLFTIPQSEWFHLAAAGQKNYTHVQTSPQGESYVIFAMPSRHGGVLAAQIVMDALWQEVAEIHFGATGIVFVMDHSGDIIAHPDRQIVLTNRNIRSSAQFQLILKAADNEWFGPTVSFDGQKVLSASVSIPTTNWILVTEVTQSEASRATNQALIAMPVSLLLLFGAAALLVRAMFSRLVIQPARLLSEGSKKLGAGDLAHRISIPRQDELGEAMAVFNQMAVDLEHQHASLQKQTQELSEAYRQAQVEIEERQKAQTALRELNAELEQRVRQRTLSLQELNADLLREVQERIAAEEQVRYSLSEKEVMLKEIHHRVKNNLQIISSLLNLQASKVTDEHTTQALLESQERVRSMALIHEKLYQSSSLAHLDFGEYVQTLSANLFYSYQREMGAVQLEVNVEPITLNLDQAIPCGLILNELVTNALKYAFPRGQKGILGVSLHALPLQQVQLCVRDNGIGMPADFDLQKSKSLGMQIVRNLVYQLEGGLEIDRSNGTAFIITFSG